MAYVKYTAKEGDRWDLIAFRAYGDAEAYGDIIAANPQIPIRPTIAAGTEVWIPVRDAGTTLDAADVPPWKR